MGTRETMLDGLTRLELGGNDWCKSPSLELDPCLSRFDGGLMLPVILEADRLPDRPFSIGGWSDQVEEGLELCDGLLMTNQGQPRSLTGPKILGDRRILIAEPSRIDLSKTSPPDKAPELWAPIATFELDVTMEPGHPWTSRR